MKDYLKDLNEKAGLVISSKGQNLDSLYAKIIEGKEEGYDFIKLEPSINHIDMDKLSPKNKMLFEHCCYLMGVKNEAYGNNPQFFMKIEEELKRTLRLIYREENQDEYFSLVENNEKAVCYIFTDSVIDFLIDKALNYHLESLLYHQKVNAKNFIQAWENFLKETPIEEKKYDSNTGLTEHILGKNKGNIKIIKHDNSLYCHLQNQIGINLKPYREDKFADVSIYSKEKFSKVYSLQYDPGKRVDILEEKHDNWYKDCLITIEHENNYLDAFTEMMYLTYRRARLKVLITYFDDHEEKTENITNVFDVLCNNFGNIIYQANTVFSENPMTEYLFILGSKLKDQKKIIWNIQAFNWAGQRTEKRIEL